MSRRPQSNHNTPIVGDISENSPEFRAYAEAVAVNLHNQRQQELFGTSTAIIIKPYNPDLITVEPITG